MKIFNSCKTSIFDVVVEKKTLPTITCSTLTLKTHEQGDKYL